MDASFNVAQNFNKITEMDQTVLDGINEDWSADSRGKYFKRIQVGNALGSIFGLRHKGVYQYSYDYLENLRRQGYVMEGNQVICVACGVHIFIPSIGKAGGCNPVPIENWHNDEKELVIPGKELATGVNYFSTVMTIKVTDPVDGSTLTNTSADYKYSYGGKTWFFSSEANYERFRETPEQFVPADMREE